MHGAMQLFGQLKSHAVAALWVLSGGIALSAFIPAFFGTSVTVRWALAVMMSLLSFGILIWALAPILKMCASLQQIVRQAEEESEKNSRQIKELEESRGRLEVERQNAEEEWNAKTREHLGRVTEEDPAQPRAGDRSHHHH